MKIGTFIRARASFYVPSEQNRIVIFHIYLHYKTFSLLFKARFPSGSENVLKFCLCKCGITIYLLLNQLKLNAKAREREPSKILFEQYNNRKLPASERMPKLLSKYLSNFSANHIN